MSNFMANSGLFWAVLGIALATLLAGIGSAIAVGKAGIAAAGVLAEEDPEVLAMMYDSPILLLLGECDRHPEKEEEYMKIAEAHVRLFYKTFRRNQPKEEEER